MIKSEIGKCVLVLMLLVIGIFLYSSNMAFASEWVKTYGSTYYFETANSIQQTTDGGYIVAGIFGNNGYAGVLKLDSNGNVQWQKTSGENSAGFFNVAASIQQTSDDGYIVAGNTRTGGKDGLGAWVLKLDSNGNVQWQKTYGGTNGDYAEDYAHSVQQTSDGGYIVLASTEDFGTGYAEAWLFKLDGNGNVQWQKAYGVTSVGYSATSIQQATDGGYIVAGANGSFGSGRHDCDDAWVLKLDGIGNVQWQKTYGGGIYCDSANSIQQTSDGGYIVAGLTEYFGAGDADAWVLKLDAIGNVQWQKTYGNTRVDLANSIQQTSDGGYIVAGSTQAFGIGFDDAWVLKLDAIGNVQWQKTYGGTDNDYANSIQQTTDGGYIVAGENRSLGAGYADAWVLKLDSSGNIHDCSIMKTSVAQVSDTNATIHDTNVTGVDTYVSPQTNTVPVLDTNAVVTELCKYGCNLVPDAISIHRGGTLGLQATGTNYTNYTGSVLFATKVTKSDGNWYPSSGFLFGPLSFYLDSYESKSRHFSHNIPYNAPLGPYTYHGYVGNYGIGNYSECQFNFTVTEQQGQGCTLCHQ